MLQNCESLGFGRCAAIAEPGLDLFLAVDGTEARRAHFDELLVLLVADLLPVRDAEMRDGALGPFRRLNQGQLDARVRLLRHRQVGLNHIDMALLETDARPGLGEGLVADERIEH